jgi:hypothetical protein
VSATRPPAFDDRFTTPIEASRRGAHRARPKPVSAGLPIVAGIAVVLLVIGGVYAVIGGNKSSSSGNQAAASALNNPDSTATAKSSGGASGKATSSAQASATAAGAASDPTDTGGTPARSGATGTVNRDVNLVVLNSVTVQGLARRAQTALESTGWTVKRTGNSINRDLAVSKIYYGRAADKATALALKKDLGFGTSVFDSSVATNGIVVVLGADAENL